MIKNTLQTLLVTLLLLLATDASAWIGSPTPRLHVDGRNLKDPYGNIVVLHGFGQTYSPWFNEQGKYWSNYDVAGCLNYNKSKIDGIMAAGWKVNFIRMHMDPYWSNTPGVSTTGENDISAFSFTRFKTYLDQVFIPMAEYAISKGLYVIMRPPGVCPEKIAVGDAYNQYLIKVWGYVSQHPKLRNNPAVMFELANEPVNILGPDGTYGAGTQGHFDNLKNYFQSIVDTMRKSADNILWVPGLGYQSLYQGFAINPIVGKNIGYAVHVYPGWFNSGQGYAPFQAGWDAQVKPVADFAPVVVTEMDWAPAKYNSSWGKDSTGTAGGDGFGANFKKITDGAGNVSWMLFTGPELLAKFDSANVATPGDTVFLNDPQACPWPVFHWYLDYARKNYPRPDFTYRSYSDNGNGTFTNPVIFGDFPDPDVIRVGDVYYMSTTTMHIFPGATILKSYDLVNWEYCSNPLQMIENNACYNLDGCNRYSHGQWASSLKYHNGTFYLHFNTLDDGSYLLTATNPEGPWTKKKLSSSFYDAGLFFDDDDKIYIVYGINNLHIAQLDADFNVVHDQAIALGNTSGIDNSGTEGSHLYKINGYYYIYATTGGYYATQVAYRSASIYGPYDEKEVFNSNRIHQGALIQTQSGEWWTMLFADKGALGRFPSLQPVTWTDNWPMVGVNGQGVTTYQKPNVGRSYPITNLSTNDNFRSYQLGKQWGWNHNPDNTKWSIFERPGYLRLRTVSVADSLSHAKNTLTQRILGFPSDLNHSYGTIKMEIDSMKEGDVAGLAVYQDPYAYIGVKISEGQRKLVMENNKVQQSEQAITDSVVYLRAVANYTTSTASFYYSFDNQTYTKFGTDLSMKYNLSVFTGNKFCLFNYPTVQTGGFVDIDWFSTEQKFEENTFYDSTFVGVKKEAITLVDLLFDKDTLDILTGSSTTLTVKALYADGHIEDISIGATYSNPKPDVIKILNGQIISKADGTDDISVSFKDPLGNVVIKVIHVISSKFPLVKNLFNPSIYASGTFNESTHTLVTGIYGFGGWTYSSGLDLSSYKYLVVKLGADNTSSASFRLYDENNYWSTPAQYDFGNSRQVVVCLPAMYKTGTTTRLNQSHIYIAGFWSTGNKPIVIDSIFLTNSTDYDSLFKSLVVTGLTTDADTLDYLTGTSSSIVVKAVYADGHTASVGTSATFINPNPEILQITSGTALAKSDGETTLTISFKDALGDSVSKNVHVRVTTFPLMSKFLNPSISGKGTFNDVTHEMQTGAPGFGGWNYTKGINLSGYKYLIAKLGSDNTSSISLRVYDVNSYTSNYAEFNFGSNRQVVIDLTKMYKKGTTTLLNPANIYIVGFRSNGSNPFIIDSVFVSNSNEYATAVHNMTVTGLETEQDSVALLIGNASNFTVRAVYTDGHKEDVTSFATYVNMYPSVVQVTSGLLTAKTNGEITITITYTDFYGNKVSKNMDVKTSTFPLSNGLFNTSLSGQGTYDEVTHTFTTDQSGLGGWMYKNGVSFSNYKYLVAKVSSPNTSNISLQVFDMYSYASGGAPYLFNGTNMVTVTLAEMYQTGTNTKIDPSHIYKVGFGSSDATPVIIDTVYLTNTPTAVQEIKDNNDNPSELVDVYTLLGVKIRSQVRRDEATKDLPFGVYIVDKKKVLVIRNY